jgi:hypothetical protein
VTADGALKWKVTRRSKKLLIHQVRHPQMIKPQAAQSLSLDDILAVLTHAKAGLKANHIDMEMKSHQVKTTAIVHGYLFLPTNHTHSPPSRIYLLQLFCTDHIRYLEIDRK